MIDNLDLDPCPLCGGRARHEVVYQEQRERGIIICNVCGLRLEGVVGVPWSEVAYKWNNRGKPRCT
jgi:transcription elongation factor Elf1